MTKSCYFCKGKVLEQHTNVDFWWGEDLKIIEDVPAGICQQCGEKYFDPLVYKKMEGLAEGSGQAIRQISVEVMKYTAA